MYAERSEQPPSNAHDCGHPEPPSARNGAIDRQHRTEWQLECVVRAYMLLNTIPGVEDSIVPVLDPSASDQFPQPVIISRLGVPFMGYACAQAMARKIMMLECFRLHRRCICNLVWMARRSCSIE